MKSLFANPMYRHLLWMIPSLAVLFCLARAMAGCAFRPAPAPAAPALPFAAADAPEADEPEAEPEEPPPPPRTVWADFLTPTAQTNLLHPDEPGVLQPTASGRLVSAKFGSTRTASVNGKLVPRFHEGIDIAALERNRKGEPLDPVRAVARGTVAAVNTAPGNSTYGRYAVVEHPDDSLGPDGKVYTLYAHLASLDVSPGRAVEAGEKIGVMGHSASGGIPVERSHLHFEVGLMLNPRYAQYTRERKITNPMGTYNGLNLFGLDPLDFVRAVSEERSETGLAFRDYLAGVPRAVELVVRRAHHPDYFKKLFPALWQGAPADGGPMWIALSESGLPLAARNATAEEKAKLGTARQVVWKVDEEALGRNARAFVTKKKGAWTVSNKGVEHLDLLFY
jgi:murein DD-endopeptidase MepM/ murein hydrolase activator NlpD